MDNTLSQDHSPRLSSVIEEFYTYNPCAEDSHANFLFCCCLLLCLPRASSGLSGVGWYGWVCGVGACCRVLASYSPKVVLGCALGLDWSSADM